MASSIEPLMTVADLDALPEDNNRYELIGGELFVSREPGLSHQRVLQNFQKFLLYYLDQNPIGILVPGPGAIFSDYDAVIPDITFQPRDRKLIHVTATTRQSNLHSTAAARSWKRDVFARDARHESSGGSE